MSAKSYRIAAGIGIRGGFLKRLLDAATHWALSSSEAPQMALRTRVQPPARVALFFDVLVARQRTKGREGAPIPRPYLPI
jgi:lipid-binding SYLF domain-containing protein